MRHRRPPQMTTRVLPPVQIPAVPVRSHVPVSSGGELVCVCVVLPLHRHTPYCAYSFLKIELLILAARSSWLPVGALILPLSLCLSLRATWWVEIRLFCRLGLDAVWWVTVQRVTSLPVFPIPPRSMSPSTVAPAVSASADSASAAGGMGSRPGH